MDRVLRSPRIRDRRRQVLAEVSGSVLEIGVGTGLNLPLYPASVRQLTCIGPDQHMAKQATRRAAERGLTVEYVSCSAESMPFVDETFDWVVSTFVLCSIADQSRAAAEIARVLRPEGRLVFLEHVVSTSTLSRLAQRSLNPINRAMACGCSLVRDAPMDLHRGGFELLRCDYMVEPSLPWVVRRLATGVARPRPYGR